MFPQLSLTATGYTGTILYSVLRWIVLMEVFQNAWSFSIFSQTKRGPFETTESRRQQGAQSAVKKGSSPVPYPWRKESERDHNDEHRLEDIFLDEVSEAGGPDDNYHFEDGTFQFLEGEEGGNDSFVAQELESFDDGDVIDRGFPSTIEEFGP
jgi:hypothetical protein